MKMPALVSKTFEANKNNQEMIEIFDLVKLGMENYPSEIEKARFIHEIIEMFNHPVFNNPLVKEYSPCTKGCSSCCHSQVSVTKSEAHLLAHHVIKNLKIDIKRLVKQARCNDNSLMFSKLSFEDKKCIFIDSNNQCSVYEDRPSVCRTNAVIGNSKQCFDNIENGTSINVVKTEKADMAIAASFLASELVGTLPNLLYKEIKKLIHLDDASKSRDLTKPKSAKDISKDQTL